MLTLFASYVNRHMDVVIIGYFSDVDKEPTLAGSARIKSGIYAVSPLSQLIM